MPKDKKEEEYSDNSGSYSDYSYSYSDYSS